jgi:hypothetical protein
MSNKTEQLVKETSAALGTEPEQLTAVIMKFKKELQELETETSTLEKQLRKVK